MLGGAYSSQFKNMERQQLNTIKTLGENDKTDQLARSKKLSLETNKRRRALVLKRKNDAEREEKRRQQILSKRRERQKEATERFQRAHMPPRPTSGISNSIRWSPRRAPQLEDALRIVRGSPATSRGGSARTQDRASPTRASYYRQNSDPLSKPYFNKYAHPSINQTRNSVEKREELHNKSLHNLNASRSLFEKQLESHQQTLLEQQQNALQEFNNQLMKEVQLDRNVTNGNQREDFERTESLSSVDSLEERVSNDTLRESCDLESFDNRSYNNRIDTGSNGPDHGHQFYASPNIPQSIDSYNTQVQYTTNGNKTKVQENDKQQFYQQRQLEIQKQLQDQQQQQFLQQQKQQQELQLRLQEKQQQLLNEEFQKKQEQLQENTLRQYEKINAGQNQPNHSTNNVRYNGTEDEKENHRPRVELKVCSTQSVQPPTSVSLTTSAYTNASPYSARSTNTNMTTVTTYDKSVIKNDDNYVNSKPVSTAVCQSATPHPKIAPQSQTPDTNIRNNVTNQNGYVPNRDFTSQGSFLETVTKDLTKQQSDVSRESENSNVTNTVSNMTNGGSQKSPTNQPISKNGANNLNSPKTNSAVNGKPPVSSAFYLNSYSSAYAVRQNLQQQQQQQHSKTVTQEPATSGPVTTVDASRLNVKGLNGAQQAVENRISLFTADPFLGEENQDTADTDSVSTIACEEREPEPKEVKSILKRTGSARGGLKKSTSNVNRHDIRDSLEITRVHLQTSAEEKEQRNLRELERRLTQDVVPTKKNVRFADLTYDESETSGQQAEDNKLFVKRNTGVGHNGTSHQRPVSAVSIKTTPSRLDQKPPRASSATVRASSIPRAKTQVVRPQAAAHIIQSPPTSNLEKKVTIINNDFMEKIPSSLRGNQPVHRASPSMVYTVGSRSDQQKVNYAVSSIVMPKGNSAPFIYPGTIQPSSSSSGPAQNVTNSKYEGAVYDDNGLRIDRTPTDDEINFLWDKVRTCLSRNSNAGDPAMESHRQAAPVANTYIDGNALGQFNSMNRVAAPPYGSNPAVNRQNSLDGANGSYAKRYGLLQQRKQQPNPNSLKSRQQLQGQGSQGYTVYHAPVPSHNEPHLTGQINGEVSESMAEFLTAEQMSEQSVSESRIHQAMDEAHVRQQAYIASKPTPSKPKSALSMEEQRLMESLDRLNDKLKEQNVQPSPHQPQQTTQQQQHQSPQQVLHVGGFKGHQPLHSQRRVIEGANPRLKITSATLKRHLHRHQ